jgi:hypothetical protein
MLSRGKQRGKWQRADQAASAARGPGATGQDALSTSPEAAVAGDGRDDAASGRLDACLAPGEGRKYDLVVTMEDATSALYSAFFVDEEGSASSFQGLREVVAKHGLSRWLYNQGSHYFVTPEAGSKVSKTMLTQVGRALSQLGVEHIAPQARGRSERVFLTLQDRLPKEFKLAGITTLEAANTWLRDTFIADYNARFAVKAE